MSELKGAMIIGQSGGPSSVINASCYGAIKAGLDSDVITKVYGAANGIVGVLNDKLYVMDEEDPEELAIMRYTPLFHKERYHKSILRLLLPVLCSHH